MKTIRHDISPFCWDHLDDVMTTIITFLSYDLMPTLHLANAELVTLALALYPERHSALWAWELENVSN